MKRTQIKKIEFYIPNDINKIILGADIFDSSSSPEARVYYIDKDDGYFLKTADGGNLLKEANMAEYFFNRGLGAEVINYTSSDRDWLLTRRVPGEDCTNELYLFDPRRLSSLLGEKLRELHEINIDGCPSIDRMTEYKNLVIKNYESDTYDKSAFPDSFGYSSANEAYKVFSEGVGCLKNEVLIHGDYCLPNVILNNWNFSGFIDLGNGGIGDRHIDLFWGSWTLWFNLKTNAYKDRFFDAYGRDKIDPEKLKIIAAAEVFG